MNDPILTILRDQETGTADFRRAADLVAHRLATTLAMKLPTDPLLIHTPLQAMEGKQYALPPLLVPILRAGIALLAPFMTHFPNASVAFVGIRRSEETAEPILYYHNIPPILPHQPCILLDPMLATAGSTSVAIDLLKEKGATRFYFAGVVGAPQGIRRLQEKVPSIDITLAAIDEGLNDKKFIVPGLGDFGDRYFHT